ncbi:L-threonylcarbamoyladenylate synthase [Bengtsoniella intestinalis]|uniref:L-threonylcarbamoyladenylate synthase n=1 Tax=Bengtsoniella intestinalis TaxID=3073143 RepID=UPI00391F8242
METIQLDLRNVKGQRRAVEAQIQQAADLILAGELVGLPTETVYGLGANGLDKEAVAKIFAAKGRPQDNPLILHLAGAQWLPIYCKDIPIAAYSLARKFWPGPLTMVLKRANVVPDVTTAGLDTVGVRCPDHGVTLSIIREAGVPIAAPSANLSGRPSCTSAEDVREDMNGKIAAIVDGGPCAVGVESTIVDLTCTPPRVLRAGGVSVEELEQVLGGLLVDSAAVTALEDGQTPKAPGMKYRHYAPKAPVTVVTGAGDVSAKEIKKRLEPQDGVICFSEYVHQFKGYRVEDLGSIEDKQTQAQRVFDALRGFDGTDVKRIFTQCPDNRGLGFAIGNRLKKAAGFQMITPKEKAVVLGLTGGTGSGKTSALKAVSAMGGQVLDCDNIYHEMLKTDQALVADLRAMFPLAFDEAGHLNRKQLGTEVFSNAVRLDQLNEIVFTHMTKEVARRLASDDNTLFAIDAINLLESGLGKLCHATVAVTSPAELRVQRITARDGIDELYAHLRINAQKPDSYYRAKCDYELENSCPSAQEFQVKATAYFKHLVGKLQEENQHG